MQFTGVLSDSGNQIELTALVTFFDANGNQLPPQEGIRDKANGVRIPLEVLPNTSHTLPIPTIPTAPAPYQRPCYVIVWIVQSDIELLEALRALSLDYGYNVLFCSVDQTSLGAVLQIVFQPNETWQTNAARMSNLRSPSGLSSSRSSKREPRQRSRLVRRPTPFWSFRPAHGPLRPSALGDEIFPVPHFCVPVPATSSSADWPSDFPDETRLYFVCKARRLRQAYAVS